MSKHALTFDSFPALLEFWERMSLPSPVVRKDEEIPLERLVESIKVILERRRKRFVDDAQGAPIAEGLGGDDTPLRTTERTVFQVR